MSPAERAARQMIADKKDQEARDRAYGKSLRMTEDAPESTEESSRTPVTKARKTAEFMEKMRMSPATTKEEQTSEGMKGPRMMRGPAEVYDAVRSMVSPRKARTNEEMNELTREVARGMKAGGKVSSASKRADGCAQRGKTKGRML